MPFQSKRQMRWAFATRQPFARRWARATRAPKRLPERARKAFTLDELELAVTKSLDPLFIELIADRVPELAAFKGEQLAPGVTRIRGDLCNVHGRYGSCSEAGFGGDTSAADTIAQNKRRIAQKPPKKTAEQRAQERAARQQQAAARRAEQASARAAKLRQQAQVQADRQATQQQRQSEARQRAEAERVAEQQRRGAQQRAEAQAQIDRSQSIARQDAERRAEVQQRQEQASIRRQAERNARERAAAERAQATEQQRATRQAERARQRQERQIAAQQQQAAARVATLEAAGLTSRDLRALRSAADGTATTATDELDRLQQLGLVEDGTDGPITTDAGRRALRALERNNIREYRAALQDIRQRQARETRTSKKRHSDMRGFIVQKDAKGRWRWISTSSNAYRDRDEEIVSTKALSGAVALADATGYRGPLRFWHVPGFDIGDCDYQAVTGNGRWLVESGTFRDEAIGQCIAEKARDWQTSIGFTHAIGEPDTSGVFDHIAIFERSITPPGRAANPFTHFVVKERTMDQAKLAEAVKLFGTEKVKELLAQIETKDASAQAAGVAFKAEEPTTPDETIVLNGVTYVREKALPSAPGEAAPPAEVPEAAMTEEPMIEAGDAIEEGLTLSPDDLQAIGDLIGSALQAALAPLVGVMEIDKTMGARMDEIKSMLGGYSAKKDDDQAVVKAQIDELSSRLKQAQDRLTELAGTQPERQAGYRPSQADDTVIPPEALPKVTKAIEPSAAQAHPFADVVQGLFGPAEVV